MCIRDRPRSSELNQWWLVTEVLTYYYEVHSVLLTLLPCLVIDNKLHTYLVFQGPVWIAGEVSECVSPLICSRSWDLELMPFKSRALTVPWVVEEDLPLE